MNHQLRRISPEFHVASKPPLPDSSSLLRKRHSLHSVESLKKLSNKHGSQHELQKRENSGSVGNLKLLDSKSRSASLAHLKTSGRTLSASNLAALSDSNLSVQVALPLRSYEDPGSQSNIAQRTFEVNVKHYFNQLTVGCGKKCCVNMFCASNLNARKLSPHIASIISIELATLGREYFCQEVPSDLTALPLNAFSDTGGKPGHFLHTFFCCSPFKFLFTNNVVQKSKKHIYKVSKSESLTDLTCRTPKHSPQSPLTTSRSTSNLNDHEKWETAVNNSIPKSGSLLKPLFNNHNLKDNLDLVGKEAKRENNSISTGVLDFNVDIERLSVDCNALDEFEDECVLEMSSSSIKELSLTHLTLPMLETSIANYKECWDPSFLINTIRTVFNSPEALNASFQRESTSIDKENVDLGAVRKAYQLLLDLEPKSVFFQPLKNSAEILLKTLESSTITPCQVFQLVILLENPIVLETFQLLQSFCAIVAQLQPFTRDALIKEFLNYDPFHFEKIVRAIQKLLASQVHVNQCSEPHILKICDMLSVLYSANIELERKGQRLVLFSDFYNEELSKKLDYKQEYEKWMEKEESGKKNCSEMLSWDSTCILDYPFALEAASKVRIIHIHAAWQMGTEYRDAIVYQARVQQAKKAYEVSDDFHVEDSVKNAMSPFLLLDIRRDHLIEDTLVQIQLKENDLKKALKIRYVGGGEQGLDLGGLQKEFFHIIINDIIQPDYGMFTYLEQVERMWINSSTLEADVMFELTGTLLGIAIYNGIILDLHFPPVIYKKLQNHPVGLSDLKDVDPSLARSLQSLLDYDGDVEDIFCYTFQISHTVFGDALDVDLKETGNNEAVTNENREEFVTLYVDYLLNKSINRQFNAFYRGFRKVCDDTCLKLFQVEELELLICGSPNIDFTLIEESTSYQNGFTRDTTTIIAFWEIVHEMTTSEKKRLLSFVTGSDRVPLKGLSTVAFQIIRQGEDTDKLPTAFTCFNQLLLPDYNSKEKLHQRLLLAIQNSKGFGLT